MVQSRFERISLIPLNCIDFYLAGLTVFLTKIKVELQFESENHNFLKTDLNFFF